ncbi:MAG TPA: alpha/beta hydrolase [Candidatus Eisenbergiella merdipullorum]|uniref:Alpha/beta hydrolase n=1 Tax=Candidatus Eisenbergiella merdipullorum TaxID=2838553 RepID=A0A9D2KZ69_9FIRM|nr:alpha/beta hydrolase [Candidatus Eisenbergiella merdipullorum]
MYFVKTTDEVNLAVYDLNPKGKRTIFLIHGWPLSHLIFEYQLEMLLSGNWRIILIDLRGFGNSDVPAGGYSYDQMAEDIYQVVCTLRLDRFVLAGFSMGGAVALRYMNRFQGYGVRRLLLLSAASPFFAGSCDFPLGLSREEVNDMIEEAASDRPAFARRFSHSRLFACCHSEAVEDWFEGIALSASGIATVQCGLSLRDEDGREDLESVRVPAVIIHGGRDQVVPPALARYQQEHIRGARLCILENSGHGIVYDELDRFNEVFLQSLEG